MLTSQDARRSSAGSTPAWAPRYTGAVNSRSHLVLTALAVASATVLIGALSFGGKPPAKTTAPELPSPSASAAAPASAVSPLERAKRGVVVLERGGRAVSLGLVLANDGRILSALSTLGDGNGIDARYADGSITNVRVGHSDRTWDLALLVPQVGRWSEGLVAANVDPMKLGSSIKMFTLNRGKPAISSVVLKARTDLIGGDQEVLRDALELSTRATATDMGSPIIDEQGRVIALVSKACLPPTGDAGAGTMPPGGVRGPGRGVAAVSPQCAGERDPARPMARNPGNCGGHPHVPRGPRRLGAPREPGWRGGRSRRERNRGRRHHFGRRHARTDPGKGSRDRQNARRG